MKPHQNLYRRAVMVLATAFTLTVTSAFAALPEGAPAPQFDLSGALAGQPRELSLNKLLAKGPVVLYFFPAAFSAGCTLEANLFAEATDDFARLGAAVVGVTSGNIERVAEFSKLECRDKFTVAADPGAEVSQRYDAVANSNGKMTSNRTSFVIAPDGKILLSYTERNPEKHVQMTMAAVRAYAQSHAR